MILDTTYLLPIAKVDVDTDLITQIDNGAVDLSLDDVVISMISIFELQARIAKYRLPSKLAVDAIEIINDNLKIEPFYNSKIIEVADILSRDLKDYIDCLILATAIALKEDLITEDSILIKMKEIIKQKYGINIYNFNDIKNRKKN